MIVKEYFYAVKCSNCGDMSELDDATFWSDESSAVEIAEDSDWCVTDDGKHYCPDCYSFDDEDNLVIKSKK
jgi:hypothetical protein